MIATLAEEDIVIPVNHNKAAIVDWQGYELYLKYADQKGGWRWNYAMPCLHRQEYIDTDVGVRIRTVLFHRELLGLAPHQTVLFMNANKLDYRLANLYVVS
jgi:hypothetical protein